MISIVSPAPIFLNLWVILSNVNGMIIPLRSKTWFTLRPG